MIRVVFFYVLIFSIFGCGNNPKSPKGEKLPAKVSTKNNPKNIETKPGYPSITSEKMQMLANDCNYTDYIFFDLPFAMSQNTPEAIQANLSYISTQSLDRIPTHCKAIARQMWHVNGEIVVEADVYFSEDCAFYIFFEKNKPIYSNQMSQQGITFYTNMIAQALQAQPVINGKDGQQRKAGDI